MDEKPFDSQNAGYAQALYEEFARNPEGVPEQWRKFFALGPQAAVEAGLIVPEGLAENGGEDRGIQADVGSPMIAAELNAAREDLPREVQVPTVVGRNEQVPDRRGVVTFSEQVAERDEVAE